MAQVLKWALVAAALRVQTAEAGAAGPDVIRFARSGYSLRGYQWDGVLGRRWAVYGNAAHPERPLLSELDPGTGGGGGPLTLGAPSAVQFQTAPIRALQMVVHSGETVTLWRDEANVRMELAAVAEGSAAIGERVQLRVTGAGIYGYTGWRATGLVRGPGSVEME